MEEPDAADEGYAVECSNTEGILEEDVNVAFTNTKDTVVPTGIWTNALLWILFFLCSTAALIVFCISNKKKS